MPQNQNYNRAAPERPSAENTLTEAEIEELGLEKVPDGFGPSWEEIIARRNPHGTE